ncbi:hypothetical protein [Pseudomonas oryzihabitans]|uniref:hypothetical protein n=1 Tax=Pseudomonas oryzihabitans TaxID=47885 RepID=UPI0028543B36|nr:hypothetical protein [Pseudomonas psychrotolerans]MDR6677467.1 5-methyltetrahydropteroyltriglutamate--homocysteine methyltransferase [Pseudomonas psychrotolerans]
MVRIHSQGSSRIERHQDSASANSLESGAIAAFSAGQQRRQEHWRTEQAAGIELLAVGDFAWGDRVLAHSFLVGLTSGQSSVATRQGQSARARWFATEQSYQVPEFARDQAFAIGWEQLFAEVTEARALGLAVKPIVLGPLSYLWLGRARDTDADRLDLLERLLPVYGEIFARLAAQGVEWIQIDEPILTLELPLAWRNAFERAYNLLQREPLKKLLAVSHGELLDNLGLATGLPVEGLHVDWPRTAQAQQALLDRLPAYKTLSLGQVEREPGQQEPRLTFIRQASERLKERLWLAPARTHSAAADAEFALWVRAAREAAAAKPVPAAGKPWSAIEAALAKLGAAQAGLASR